MKSLVVVVVLLGLAGAPTLAGVAEDHEVVPDVVDSVPNGTITVDFKASGKSAMFGNELTPTQVKSMPTLSWPAEEGAYYTIAMVDPDAPTRKDPKNREFLHFMTCNIPGNDISKGLNLFGYVGSGPPEDTGLHRYVYLAYKQPGLIEFEQQPVPNSSRKNRAKFSIRKFAKDHGLGEPVAYNFYQAKYDDYVPILYSQFTS